MARRINAEQLLNLVDRAERGRLTTEEAARLRSGIAQLKADRTALQVRLRVQGRWVNVAAAELKALHGLVKRSQERGVAQLPVWTVAALLSDEPNQEAA